MCFVAQFHDCTGSDFETNHIAQTGNEKSSSIAVHAHSDNNYSLKIKVH